MTLRCWWDETSLSEISLRSEVVTRSSMWVGGNICGRLVGNRTSLCHLSQFWVSLNNSDRGLLHIQADVSLLSPLIDRNAAHVYLSNSSSCKYSSKASTSTRRRMSWLMILSYAALLVLPLPADRGVTPSSWRCYFGSCSSYSAKEHDFSLGALAGWKVLHW